MTSTEKAKAIRTALKKAGFNQKQVSVKKEWGGYSVAFYVTIRVADIEKSTIEKIVNKFKNIDYDKETGEILAGGNDYVFVQKQILNEMDEIRKQVERSKKARERLARQRQIAFN